MAILLVPPPECMEEQELSKKTLQSVWIIWTILPEACQILERQSEAQTFAEPLKGVRHRFPSVFHSLSSKTTTAVSSDIDFVSFLFALPERCIWLKKLLLPTLWTPLLASLQGVKNGQFSTQRLDTCLRDNGDDGTVLLHNDLSEMVECLEQLQQLRLQTTAMCPLQDNDQAQMDHILSLLGTLYFGVRTAILAIDVSSIPQQERASLTTQLHTVNDLFYHLYSEYVLYPHQHVLTPLLLATALIQGIQSQTMIPHDLALFAQDIIESVAHLNQFHHSIVASMHLSTPP